MITQHQVFPSERAPKTPSHVEYCLLLPSEEPPNPKEEAPPIQEWTHLARFLNAQQLLTALGAILPRKPCHRTLQRWASQGLPYHLHPGNRTRLFVFQDVYHWLSSKQVRRDLAQEAIDRSHLGRPTRRTTRKSA